jgi:hypothetical protein
MNFEASISTTRLNSTTFPELQYKFLSKKSCVINFRATEIIFSKTLAHSKVFALV